VFALKKIFKWLSIASLALLILLLAGVMALPLIFPLDRIKDFAAAKISESIRREVKIEKAQFDLFSGIKLKGIYIGNREGFSPRPFISADAIELRYAFWPLFSRQIIVKELRLVKPEILIEKNRAGEFNFSDLSRPSTQTRTTAPTHKADHPPFNLLVSSFSVKDGKFIYADQAAGTSSEINHFNLQVSGFALALVKPIELKASADIAYQGKNVPLSLAGKIGINLPNESINITPLSFSLAGESISGGVKVSGWKRAPQVEFSISSKKISADPLLAIFAVPSSPTKKQRGELTKNIDRAMASFPGNLTLKGEINLEQASFQKFKADKINLSLTLFGKRAILNIKEIRFYEGTLAGRVFADLSVSGLAYEFRGFKLIGFDSAPFVNSLIETFLTALPDYKDLLDKVYGKLFISLSMKGRGVEAEDLLAHADGSGSFSLMGGELKRQKTLAEIGAMIKSNSLQEDIRLKALSSHFSIKNRIFSAQGMQLEGGDLKARFDGSLDLDQQIWVPGNRLTLKLSPSATRDLGKEYEVLRDPQGWAELTFELTGPLKKPLPRPILDQPVEVVIGKVKAKIEAQKVEIEQKAQQKLEEEKARLQEEAKGKLQELLKF
jgi:uncharacterized protein involved in outer membrane biogenesis